MIDIQELFRLIALRKHRDYRVIIDGYSVTLECFQHGAWIPVNFYTTLDEFINQVKTIAQRKR